nr:hypothetical protein [Actinomycetota bacterium]
LWHTYVLGEPLSRVEAAVDEDESDPARGIVRRVTDEDLQPPAAAVTDGAEVPRPDGSAPGEPEPEADREPEHLIPAGGVTDVHGGAGPDPGEGGDASSAPAGQGLR